jgi:3-deoxy-D-manno-octulosonic-acid transferase
MGPYTANFTESVGLLRDADALETVADAPTLAEFVNAMLRDPSRRIGMACRAATVVRRYSDLPARIARTLLQLLHGSL